MAIFLSEEKINELYYIDENEEKKNDEVDANIGDKLYCLQVVNLKGIEIMQAWNSMLLIQKDATPNLQSYLQLERLKKSIDEHCHQLQACIADHNLSIWQESVASLLAEIFFGFTDDFETDALKKYSEHMPPTMYYLDKHQSVYSREYTKAYDIKEEEISFELVKSGITGTIIAGALTMIGFCLPLSLPATAIMVVVTSALLLLCPLVSVYFCCSSVMARAEEKFEYALEKTRSKLDESIRIKLDDFLMQSLFEANLLGLKAQKLYDTFCVENPSLKKVYDNRIVFMPPGAPIFRAGEEEVEQGYARRMYLQ